MEPMNPETTGHFRKAKSVLFKTIRESKKTIATIVVSFSRGFVFSPRKKKKASPNFSILNRNR
jgi:hypothetical protein